MEREQIFRNFEKVTTEAAKEKKKNETADSMRVHIQCQRCGYAYRFDIIADIGPARSIPARQ